MMSSSLLSDIAHRLSSKSDTPALDASVLIAHVINKPRTWVMAHPELTLTTEQHQHLEDSLARLERGESFPYVIGHWEFFGLDFEVTPDVLIPRPETELLVEKAISSLNKHPEARSIADVGTGSGAIAVSIAVNVLNANILATDISSKALEVAKRNAQRHGVINKINFVECNLLPDQRPSTKDGSSSTLAPHARAGVVNRQSSIDLICANLPYIPTEVVRKLPIYGHEPTVALDGGTNGFEVIERLMRIAPQHLAPNSLMLFEIEATLGKQAIELAHRMFPNASIELHQDLTGRNRLLEIQLP